MTSPISESLEGRRALVTGGTKGTGAAIARRLAEAGAEVLVTARSRPEEVEASIQRRMPLWNGTWPTRRPKRH